VWGLGGGAPPPTPHPPTPNPQSPIPMFHQPKIIINKNNNIKINGKYLNQK